MYGLPAFYVLALESQHERAREQDAPASEPRQVAAPSGKGPSSLAGVPAGASFEPEFNPQSNEAKEA